MQHTGVVGSWAQPWTLGPRHSLVRGPQHEGGQWKISFLVGYLSGKQKKGEEALEIKKMTLPLGGSHANIPA